MRLVPALVALTALAAAPLLHFQGLHLPCPYYAPIVDIPPANVPHPSPLEGPYAPNALLQTHAVKLFRGAEKPGAQCKPGALRPACAESSSLHLQQPWHVASLRLAMYALR